MVEREAFLMFVVHFTLLLILPTVAMNSGDHFFMVMLPIAAIGVMLNRHVMTQNGMKMPVKMDAKIVRAAHEAGGYTPLGSKTRRAWLSDWMHISFRGYYRAFSVGDLFVWAGCGLAWLYLGVLIFRGATQ